MKICVLLVDFFKVFFVAVYFKIYIPSSSQGVGRMMVGCDVNLDVSVWIRGGGKGRRDGL